MYVGGCAFVCVRMYVCVPACMRLWTYVCIHMYICLCIYMRECVRLCERERVHLCVRVLTLVPYSGMSSFCPIPHTKRDQVWLLCGLGIGGSPVYTSF